MAKADDEQWLSAAECASRTGLTVRALRVYEREKLIKPSRTAKGWRRYGQAELTRLNTIVILKTLGLTLAQIRKVLVENPPSLANILQIQQESWREKRATADRALILVESACKRLLSQQTLSICLYTVGSIYRACESRSLRSGRGRRGLGLSRAGASAARR